MNKDMNKEKCKYMDCNEIGKYLESDGRGNLIHLCLTHRRHLVKQGKAWGIY